jgi:hypothetical protein
MKTSSSKWFILFNLLNDLSLSFVDLRQYPLEILYFLLVLLVLLILSITWGGLIGRLSHRLIIIIQRFWLESLSNVYSFRLILRYLHFSVLLKGRANTHSVLILTISTSGFKLNKVLIAHKIKWWVNKVFFTRDTINTMLVMVSTADSLFDNTGHPVFDILSVSRSWPIFCIHLGNARRSILSRASDDGLRYRYLMKLELKRTRWALVLLCKGSI